MPENGNHHSLVIMATIMIGMGTAPVIATARHRAAASKGRLASAGV
jgi:hypothetical protein